MKENNCFEILILFLLLNIFILNPSNKITIFLFILFSIFLLIFKKSLFYALVIPYLITSYLPYGKTYFYQIMNLDFLPHLKEEYPLGLVQEIKITINDVFFGLIVIHLLRELFIKRINLLKFFNKTVFFYILFIFFIFLSNIIASPNWQLSIFINKAFFKILFIYFYLRVNQKYISQLSFLKLIWIIIFFESYLALFQFFNGAPLGKNIEAIHNIEIFGKTVDEISFYYRPTGTFQHANFLGGFLSLAISLQIYLILFLRQKTISNLIVLLLSAIALLNTLSRSAFYSLVVFLLLLFLNYRKLINKNLKKINKKIVVFLIISFLFLFPISIIRFLNIFDPFSPSGGFHVRLSQLKEVKQLIFLKPFFGTGSNFSVVEAIKINPYGVFASFPSPIHNFYLLLTVENGVFSITFFILFLIYMLKDFLSKNKVFSFILISSIFYSFFQPIFLIEEIFYLSIIMNSYERNEKTFYKS